MATKNITLQEELSDAREKLAEWNNEQARRIAELASLNEAQARELDALKKERVQLAKITKDYFATLEENLLLIKAREIADEKIRELTDAGFKLSAENNALKIQNAELKKNQHVAGKCYCREKKIAYASMHGKCTICSGWVTR